MKLSCLQENFSRGLGVVARAVAARTTLPITNNVLLATDRSRLKLVATNLEMAVSCWIGAKVEEEGAITVPARLLTEFVGSLPSDKVDIALSPQTKTLELKCARFEARISGIDAKDFPPIPTVDEGITTKSRWKLSVRELTRLFLRRLQRNPGRYLRALTPSLRGIY